MKHLRIVIVTLGLMVLLTASRSVAGDEPAGETTMLLWPNDTKLNSPEGKGKNGGKGDKAQATDVTTPHLKVYPGPTSNKPTPAILLVPGGAYSKLVYGKHLAIQQWFAEKGVRAFILMYRCPTSTSDKGALEDIQEAIKLVRSRAKEWNIDPKRVGLLGSSAGGHLSVRASNAQGDDTVRPDFAILLYPAYLADTKTKALESGIMVSKKTPPTLIVAARDDKAFFHNSPIYEEALKKAGVPVSSQYFDTGDHGFSLRTPKSVNTWPETCESWLKEISILP